MPRLRKRGPEHPSSGNQKPLLEAADRLLSSGQTLEEVGDFEAALAHYQRSAVEAPTYPRAHMNVGNALRKLGRFAQAVAAQQRAVNCDPGYAPAHFNLGSLLLDVGELVDAENELRGALRLQPDMFQALVVLADLLETQGRFGEAEVQFQEALAAAPGHAGSMLNYGTFCFRRNKFDEAIAWIKKAKAADARIKDAESSLLFSLNFRADVDAEIIWQEHERVGRVMTDSAGPPFSGWSNLPERDRRLRVGYVSGDLTDHPVALFLRPVLDKHNVESFETFCFSNYSHSNPVTDALRDKADHWRDISQLGDQETAELFRRDNIDILVDLSGHTGRNRLSVFARHPAPIQATWLGYLNTTGLPAMDYRIVDSYTDPESTTEAFHTETLVRMPHSQWCYAPWFDTGAIPISHTAPPDALVLGSFNQYRKISDQCLEAWCNILRLVPEGELLVYDVQLPAMRKDLLRRVEGTGIDPSRVTVRRRERTPAYLSALGNVDVALDSFPYNGATTTLDTLWMGVPIVGLRGDRGISRSTYSILRSLGADDLIANNIDEYVEINVRLAQDSEWRQRLRSSLRDRLAASPLMDATRFTRALESLYREMWQAWCSTQSSRTIALGGG